MEFKFRIWNKSRLSWENPFYSAICCDSCDENILLISPGIFSPYSISYQDYVIQQFIGLKDKNGHDIYDGDIVSFQIYSSEHEVEDCTGEVFFENGIFFFGREELFATNDMNFKEDSLEIIGNIFENAAK